MWFGKLSLKAAALVLFGAVSSMAAESSISPMTFNASSATAEIDNWNYLRNFKLWGSTSIKFGNRPGFYDNEAREANYANVDLLTLGWVGTAKGNIESYGHNGEVDGPIIVGGNVINTQGSQQIKFLTGPVRYTGSSLEYEKNGSILECQNTNTNGACAKVPLVRPSLRVPELDDAGKAKLKGKLNVTGKKDNPTVINVDNVCTESGMCDLYYDEIHFNDDARLVISMPEEGRVTRIFANKITRGPHPQVVVRYPSGNRSLKNYEGNLLIYIVEGITDYGYLCNSR